MWAFLSDLWEVTTILWAFLPDLWEVATTLWAFCVRLMGETLNLQVFCTTNIHIFYVFRKFSCYVHKKLLKSENIYDNI